MPLPRFAIEGRLTADPELRFTSSGAAVSNFTIVANDRVKDGDQWKDGDALFMRCSIWRKAAENVAESLTKGDLVIGYGRLKQREFTTKEGEKRTVVEMELDTIGPALTWDTAKVQRASRGSSGGSSNSARAADPWGSSAGSSTDEPPY